MGTQVLADPGARVQELGCRGTVGWASQSASKTPLWYLTRGQVFHLTLAGLALRGQTEGGHWGSGWR